jgi:hypothetical protein
MHVILTYFGADENSIGGTPEYVTEGICTVTTSVPVFKKYFVKVERNHVVLAPLACFMVINENLVSWEGVCNLEHLQSRKWVYHGRG